MALNATKLVSVQPATDGWTVTAAHAVGAVRCDDLTIRVQPKVGTVQTLRLLARAHGIAAMKLEDLPVEIANDLDLSSALALLFTAEASRAMAAGPLRGYRTEDQTSATLRGRLRVREQELRRFGQLVPIDVTVDEWTSDTAENRRLRAAAGRLLMLPDLPRVVRARLVRLDRQLAEVSLPTPGAPIEPWTPNRLNARLHTMLKLADLVLAGRTVEHRVGDVAVTGFVLSMPRLFELLVSRLLADASTDLRVAEQQSYGFDTTGTVTIKPDIILTRNRRAVAVVDVKYKLLDAHGRFPNADAYQLLAYCTRLGLDRGHLIYAAGDPQPEPIKLVGSQVRLVIYSVDLSRSIRDLEYATSQLLHEMSGAAEQVAATNQWRYQLGHRGVPA